jgi:hypothetical protein
VEKTEEIQHCLAGDTANFLQIGHAGDAGGNGQEDDRRDDHLHELDESVAKRLQRRADVGIKVPEQNARGDGGQTTCT